MAIVFHDRQRFLPRAAHGSDVVHSASSPVPGWGAAAPLHAGGDSFRGMYYALLRSRIPFDLAHVVRLDEASLAQYKLLVLSHVAALSDDEAENVRRFARRGGAVLATFETGAYDEWGRLRTRGALDDLLGVTQRWPTTGPLTHAYAQLHHNWDRHGLLTGLEETEVTLGTDYLVPVQPAAGTHSAALTLIPTYPPEEAFTRTGDSGLPFVLLTEGAAGEGRRVFWPGNVDAFFMATNAPDYSRLLRNSVEWAFPGEQPAQVTGPGLIEVHPYRQERSLQVHLVNFTNPDAWRAPVHELLPVRGQTVRVRVPNGESVAHEARCLVSGRTLPVARSGEWAEAVLPELLDHEIVVFDLT
ncbi:MAG: beta-galactosidase trimerization domain-containing protein [Ardenticatenaceae bacterium]|nr:beta-galactosidase trimerization domain-containing protein [Ardenticatenaceae bacterium]